jgi:hypothetical protein
VSRFACVLSCLLLVVPLGSLAAERPLLWGYGVKPCAEFLEVRKGWLEGDESTSAEYLAYRDWLAGFVSGLSLATGEDMLRGAALSSTLDDIAKRCTAQGDEDFFNATSAVLRALSLLP